MAMEDLASGMFGQFPDLSSSFTPEEAKAIQSNAAKQALLASAVTMLGMSGPQRVPVGTGQAIGAALGAGLGGYQGSFDNTLKQMVAAQQMADYRAKAEARQRYNQAIAQATTMQPQAIPMATGEGSQLEMLSRPEFGGDMAEAETVGALRANLPTVKKVDQRLADTAALDFLRSTDPAKYLELTAKTDATPADLKKYEFAVKQGYKGSFLDFEKELRASGASRTVLDMTGGQKGFENEMKLRGEFKSEPVYKAYTEMQSAYGQINDGLNAESPAGDLAAATKFMKLLDPGSVVRESELGMAMSATGMLDKAKNYAELRMSGKKLTPDQRKDFKQVSDALFSTATSVYNQKRNELVQQGSGYGLNAERALGAPAKMPNKNIKVSY